MPTTKPKYIPHDRLFKEFFERFLAEFVYIFLPDKAVQLDFGDINFFKQELVVNFPRQALRITDVVAEVALKEFVNEIFATSDNSHKQKKKKKSGEEDDESDSEPEKERELIIIHVDAEANHPQTIPSRMFVYYALLRVIKGMPVLPIAFIIQKGASQPAEKGEDAITIETYTETLWGHQHVSFDYYQVDLGRLRSEDYLKNNDPVEACLAALMHHSNEKDGEIKKTIFDIIVQSNLDDGDKAFLAEVVSTYMPNEQIQSATEEIMEQLVEYEKTVFQLIREEAEMTGLQKAVIKLLRKKFGAVTNDLADRIKKIKDETTLDELMDQILSIDSLDKFALPEMT
ncbi:MAG: hypothetical protein AAF639_24075 [Chloroflexota bacterium]